MFDSKPHAYLDYIHACMGYKHHDLLFKYLNPLLYWLSSLWVFYTCTHTHTPHPFVDTDNFPIMHAYMHTHSAPLGILYITHTFFCSLCQSPMIYLRFSISLFPTHADRYTPLASQASLRHANMYTHSPSPPLTTKIRLIFQAPPPKKMLFSVDMPKKN